MLFERFGPQGHAKPGETVHLLKRNRTKKLLNVYQTFLRLVGGTAGHETSPGLDYTGGVSWTSLHWECVRDLITLGGCPGLDHTGSVSWT